MRDMTVKRFRSPITRIVCSYYCLDAHLPLRITPFPEVLL